MKALIDELKRYIDNGRGLWAKVEEVNTDGTCEVSSENENVPREVRLPFASQDGACMVPAAGATVFILRLAPGIGLIVWMSATELVYLRGGAFGGLVKVEPLLSKLNALEDAHNALVAKFNTHTHTSTAPTLPTGPSVPQSLDTVTKTKKTDIENANVKHG